MVTTLTDHWWWRPGWRPGRRMYAWHVTFTGLPAVRRLAAQAQNRLAGIPGLDLVPARWLHLLGGPRGMAELAHCFGVEKAALTGLMDRAERRGLAQRSPVPGDRRALQATLTGTGRRVAAAFHAEVNMELTRLLSALAPHDREQFRSTVAEIIARCRTSAQPGHR